jgi:hypothetical protein
MLDEGYSLFNLGTTIGIITSNCINEEEEGWSETDLEYGIIYGFGWKTGTSDKTLKKYENQLKSKMLMKNLDRLTEKRKQLEKQLTSCQVDSDVECNQHPTSLDKILRIDQPYSLQEVFKGLIEATDILLHKKDYDGHGWEKLEYCYNQAEVMQNDLDKLNQILVELNKK